MLQPNDVTVKTVEMIFDAKSYKNGDSIEYLRPILLTGKAINS
jgi:hypothetical protein